MYAKNYVIFFILIILLPITLIGCTSMLGIGAAALITSTWNDSRTIGVQLDDNILKIHIYYALSQHAQIKKFTRITNTVYQNNVLLTGQSPSDQLAKLAVQIVMNIDGVKKIYNAIRNDQPISIQDILIDTWISNKIRFSLITQENIFNIKVISENKEVFLIGQVTQEEGLNAEKIARKTNGVRNVFTAFFYI